MAEKNLLQKAVYDSGLKVCYIAEKLGMARPTLYSRLKDPSKFTGAQIKELCQLLRIDTATRNKIFFA